MSVDQLFEFMKAIGLSPKFMKRVDLENAVGCVTAGNQLLHGARPSDLNYAQFLEALGSLAINCLSPERMEEQGFNISLGTPFQRMDFLFSHVDGI